MCARSLVARKMIQKRRNPHDALFRAAESAGRAFERRKGAQLRQNARTAQQQKNWALAESLWRKSLEDEPGERSAVVGLAQVLVYNGKFDEAERLAGEILAKWPADENGPTVLARLAEERGDAAGAMREWRRVLELSPTRSQALIRLGRLMIVGGDYDGARECADRLAMVAPDNPAAISLLAEIDEAKGDRASAVKRRRALTEKFPQQSAFWRDYGAALIEAGEYGTCEALVARLKASDPQNGLRLEGQLLGARAPEQGHSEFWRAAHAAWPDNADFLRKYLHAALRDGGREEARGLLAHLFAGTLLRASDANFVIGLINMLDDAAEIRKLVRSFLKRFRGTSDYRRLGIRLSRIVFADFARRPTASAAHTLVMLRHAQCDPAAKAFLEHAIAALDGTLADTDIARGECERFVAEVRSKLAAKTPWSLIRVGDAESNALTYAPESVRHFDSDAAEREMVWWGRALDPAPRAALATRVRAAMRDADALGVPTLERLLRDVRLERRDFLSPTRAGRGLRTVMREMEEGGALAGARDLVTSAHIQHDLEKWDLYPALFDGVDDIVAVSCHARLSEVMNLALNIVVPPRHASLASFGLREMGPKILPEVLDETIARLPDDLAGRLVIVGAGYAGKVIIQEAKKRGAVALDLGSILDYWVGAATRSYLTAGRI
jgi:tetratricopeptide (TPR) repeat protein